MNTPATEGLSYFQYLKLAKEAFQADDSFWSHIKTYISKGGYQDEAEI